MTPANGLRSSSSAKPPELPDKNDAMKRLFKS